MYDYLDSVIKSSWMYMHDRKHDLVWQTCIITEVVLFVVQLPSLPRLRVVPFVGLAVSYVSNVSIIFDCSMLLYYQPSLQKNTLPWWYVFVTVGRVFCPACTSMINLWQNQDSHTCAVVEVFHDNTKIIVTEVSTSMTINGASWKCFR